MSNYSVTIDKEAGILTCRILGFLDKGAVSAMADAIRAAIPTARGPSGLLLALFENREGIVLGGETVSELTGALATNRHASDRTAILVSSSLATMQARRTMSGSSEVFTDEAAARAWLISERRTLLGEG